MKYDHVQNSNRIEVICNRKKQRTCHEKQTNKNLHDVSVTFLSHTFCHPPREIKVENKVYYKLTKSSGKAYHYWELISKNYVNYVITKWDNCYVCECERKRESITWAYLVFEFFGSCMNRGSWSKKEVKKERKLVSFGLMRVKRSLLVQFVNEMEDGVGNVLLFFFSILYYNSKPLFCFGRSDSSWFSERERERRRKRYRISKFKGKVNMVVALLLAITELPPRWLFKWKVLFI